MLADSMSAQNIRRMTEKHAEKVHFVPIRYRSPVKEPQRAGRDQQIRQFAVPTQGAPDGGSAAVGDDEAVAERGRHAGDFQPVDSNPERNRGAEGPNQVLR